MNAFTPKFVAVVATLAFGINAHANEVVLSEGAEKRNGTSVALDFVSSGAATAFQFEVAVPRNVTSVNTAKCVSDVPSTHVAACRFNEKSRSVIVMVYSNENAVLPAGIVPVGSLELVGGRQGQAKIKNALVSDTSAEPLPVRVIDSVDQGSRAKGAAK